MRARPMALNAHLLSVVASAGHDGQPAGAAKEMSEGRTDNFSRSQEVAEQERRVPAHGIPGHHHPVDLRLSEELCETLTHFINGIPRTSYTAVIPSLFVIPEEDLLYGEVLGKSKELEWRHAYLLVDATEQDKSDIPGLV